MREKKAFQNRCPSYKPKNRGRKVETEQLCFPLKCLTSQEVAHRQ